MARHTSRHAARRTWLGGFAVCLIVAFSGYLLVTNVRVNRTATVTSDTADLVEQREELIGIPQVPGSYFISRHLTNAFRSVVISGAEPRESLVEYTETINREIADKIDEFS